MPRLDGKKLLKQAKPEIPRFFKYSANLTKKGKLLLYKSIRMRRLFRLTYYGTA